MENNETKELSKEEQVVKDLSEQGFKISYFPPQNLQEPEEDDGYGYLFSDNIFSKYKREIKDIGYGDFSLEEYKYTPEKVMLIHTTNVFALDNYLKAPQNGEVLSKNNLGSEIGVLFDRCKEFLTNKRISEGQEAPTGYNDEFLNEVEIYKNSLCPYLRQHRSTKHFTQNCLVSSHGGGDWSNMPFIYLEPMVREGNFTHLDESCLSLAPHDTFFKDGLQMHEPTLMLSEQALNQLLNYPDKSLQEKILQTLKDTNLVLIDPSKDPAIYVDNYLASKGYPFYECDEHSVKYVDDKNGIHGVYETLTPWAKEHNVSQSGDHFYSQSRKDDEDAFAKNIYEDTKDYLLYITTNCKDFDADKLQYLQEKIKEVDTNNPNEDDINYNSKIYDLQRAASKIELFETIDLQSLKEITDAYNQEFLEKYKSEYVRIENITPETQVEPEQCQE